MAAEPLTEKERTHEYWAELNRKYLVQGIEYTDIVLEKGKGVEVWDVTGKKYLDFGSGQMAMIAGHSHPAFLQAIRDQIELLMQIGNQELNVPRILLAKKLAEITPDPFQKSYFVSAGGECVEAALRFAKKTTGRWEVVALMGGYHGMTLGSMTLTTTRGRAGYGVGPPGTVFIPAPYCYRCPFNETPPCTFSCIDYGEEIIERTTTGEPAALLIEVIQGSTAGLLPPVDWLKRIGEICHRRGMLFIVDESLTGLGRTGKWFAFEHFGIIPDVIVTAKGLGQGVPVAAYITSEKIAAQAASKGYHQSATHKGDPFQCAAGLANVEIIEREKLLDRASKMGARLKKGLEDIASRCEVIGDVRGIGLFLGMEIVESRDTKKPAPEIAWNMRCGCAEKGLLLSFNKGKHIGRLCPPLVITEAQVDTSLTILEEVFHKIAYVSKT